jgi:hypothetical protein
MGHMIRSKRRGPHGPPLASFFYSRPAVESRNTTSGKERASKIQTGTEVGFHKLKCNTKSPEAVASVTPTEFPRPSVAQCDLRRCLGTISEVTLYFISNSGTEMADTAALPEEGVSRMRN